MLGSRAEHPPVQIGRRCPSEWCGVRGGWERFGSLWAGAGLRRCSCGGWLRRWRNRAPNTRACHMFPTLCARPMGHGRLHRSRAGWLRSARLSMTPNPSRRSNHPARSNPSTPATHAVPGCRRQVLHRPQRARIVHRGPAITTCPRATTNTARPARAPALACGFDFVEGAGRRVADTQESEVVRPAKLRWEEGRLRCRRFDQHC